MTTSSPVPWAGILRRKNFPSDALRPRDARPHVLEPEEFRRVVAELRPPALQMVLVAGLTGLRWGEQVAVRIEEEVDFRHSKIRITRSFYRRILQTPKADLNMRVKCAWSTKPAANANSANGIPLPSRFRAKSSRRMSEYR